MRFRNRGTIRPKNTAFVPGYDQLLALCHRAWLGRTVAELSAVGNLGGKTIWCEQALPTEVGPDRPDEQEPVEAA
ncbi:hypothetical protein [Streptomyces cavernae]|uniref:hypothetical protein n=1 Tax=Streptomyces cavernae TaxID=2259034 RepID=UPI001EE3C4D9|nr:hypothetical protein [Streptomyces cavernae]